MALPQFWLISKYKSPTISAPNMQTKTTLIVSSPIRPTPETPQPNNWDNQTQETTNSLQLHKKFPVGPQSKEYEVVCRLVENTSTVVTNIQRILNPSVWARFVAQRKEMLFRKSADLELISQLDMSEQEVLRRTHIILNSVTDPAVSASPYSDNMALLLHCVRDKNNLEAILNHGMDERMGQGGLLGRGLYFSDRPGKAKLYDGCDGVMLVVAVLLGDCTYYPKEENRVREPEKQRVQMRNHEDLFFDSLICRTRTGNTTTTSNEYVVYNRAQTYPMYLVNYEAARRTQNDYCSYQDEVSPFAWLKSETKPERLPQAGAALARWPFYAQTAIEMMAAEEGKSDDRQDLGISNSDDYLLDYQCTGMAFNSSGQNSKLYDENTEANKVNEPKREACGICYYEHSLNISNWNTLACSHKICSNCFGQIKTTGTTMTGFNRTAIKCPFCQKIQGTLIGTCPDGSMTYHEIRKSCEGYNCCESIEIHYQIFSFNEIRTAYLPNTAEGQEVLELLRVAWDQRLIFSIGTSATTGRGNTLVWNVHHKTATEGGFFCHGYPDPGYFQRVKEELKGYGIE